MTLFTLLSRGFALGFAASVTPGPLTGYMMNVSLKHGWRRALWVIVSPLIVDIPIILAVLLALDAIATRLPQFIDIIRGVGGIFVLYLAWGAWNDFRAGTTATEIDTPQQVGDLNLTILPKAMLLNALSPGPYLFWTLANGPLLQQALEQSPLHGIIFLIAFYGTFLGLLTAQAFALDRLRRLDARLMRGMLLAACVLLAGVGGWLLVTGLIALGLF